jgi:hypothetical protein
MSGALSFKSVKATVTATAAELNQLDGDSTAALKVPVGTTAQRPTPATGQIRYNSDETTFEGYDGTEWGAIGGGGGDFSAVAEDIIPDADSTRDLGSSSVAWAVAYFDAIEPVGADTTIKRVGGTNTTPIVEGIAKAWVNFNGTGTIAARDSENVSSLTDNGAGDYTVNFTNNFAAADYSGSGIAGRDSEASCYMEMVSVTSVSSLDVQSRRNSDDLLSDRPYMMAAIHGDLA